MSQQYRICHNCGESLTPDQAYCPRCGAQYVAPIVQQPVVPPPPQPQTPYPPQGQGYTPPSYPANYGQQTPMAPGPEQVSGSPQPPTSQTGQGVSPFLIIGIVVVILLLLVGVGSLFYNLGQQNNSKPGTTLTPGITPTPTPTPGVTPTLTPKITPTPTAFQVPATGITENRLSIVKTSSISAPTTVYSRGGACPALAPCDRPRSFKRT